MDLSVRIERWPLAATFAISRGSKTEAVVVVAELSDGTHRGRGECVPYARYGETPDGVVAAIEALRPVVKRGFDRAALARALPAGAARNALDCACWDLSAKRARPPRARIGRAFRPEAAHDRLHDLAGIHSRNGCGGGARRLAALAEGQARRRT